jgi:F0F1-type ATP synthase assembly protein I
VKPYTGPDQGESQRNARQNTGFLHAAMRYTSMAMALPGFVTGGYIMGYFLDKWLGTGYLKIVFLIIGIIGGFMELVRQLMRDMKKPNQ